MKLSQALLFAVFILGLGALGPNAGAQGNVIANQLGIAPTRTARQTPPTPTPTPTPKPATASAGVNFFKHTGVNIRSELIDPPQLTSMFELGVTLAEVQSTNLLRRMDELHSGVSSPIPSDGKDGKGVVGAGGPGGPEGKDAQSAAPNLPDNRWGFFVTGIGDFTNVGSHNGYDLTTGGFTLGVDYKLTPNLAIGLMGGYAGTGIDLPNSGRILADSGTVGLYGTYFQGGFYVDTAVSGSYNSYDSHRTALEGDARGDTDGGQLNVLFATGYDFKFGGLTIGPTGTFQYTYVNIDGFSERGSFAPLTFGSQSVDSLTSAFGIKASYDLKLGGAVVRPELRLAWQHEYGDCHRASDWPSASARSAILCSFSRPSNKRISSFQHPQRPLETIGFYVLRHIGIQKIATANHCPKCVRKRSGLLIRNIAS